MPADFNGDGRSDLISLESGPNPESQEISFVVLYAGSGRGFLDVARAQTVAAEDLARQIPRITGATAERTISGVPAPGFFDADCYADLAVTFGNSLVLLHGSSQGISLTDVQAIPAGEIGPSGSFLLGSPAAGDFNGDGITDLIETDQTETGHQAPCVVYGSAGGLAPEHGTCFIDGIGQKKVHGIGSPFAVGDINGDHRDDIAVGYPTFKVGGDEFAGGVVILYGSAAGLNAAGSQFLNPQSAGVLGPLPHPAGFGSAVAIADVTGDGRAELIVGTPDSANQDNGPATVTVYRGTSSGVSVAGRQLFTLTSPGMPGPASPRRGFGSSLASGDFNGDGHADLAIGRPHLAIHGGSRTIPDAGMVDILYGTARGLSTSGAHALTQVSPGVPLGEPGAADKGSFGDFEFGSAMTVLAGPSGEPDDLVIGVPHNLYAEEGTKTSWIIVLPGSKRGLTTDGSQLVSSDQLSAYSIGARFGT